MGEFGEAAGSVAPRGLADLGDQGQWDKVIKEALAKARPPSAWTPLMEGEAQAKKDAAPPTYLALLSMDGKRKSALGPCRQRRHCAAPNGPRDWRQRDYRY